MVLHMYTGNVVRMVELWWAPHYYHGCEMNRAPAVLCLYDRARHRDGSSAKRTVVSAMGKRGHHLLWDVRRSWPSTWADWHAEIEPLDMFES